DSPLPAPIRLYAGGCLFEAEVLTIGAADFARLRALEAAQRVAALVACPPVMGEKSHEVGAAHNPDQPAFAQDGDAPDALAGQEMGDRLDVGVLGNRDHPAGHDVTNRPAVAADHIELAHQARHN